MLWVDIFVKRFRCTGILLLQLQCENFAHRQHFQFCHFQPVHCAIKNVYLQTYSTDFRNLCLSSKMMRGTYVWRFQVRRYFTFAMERWKLCASTTFEILPLSTCGTVPAKVLYLNRYSTNFRNLCLSSKLLIVDIWLESFRCAGSLLLQWQGENVAHRPHLKFCHFQPVPCASKNPISPKVSNRFSKSFPPLEDVEGRIWVKRLRCAGILLLQWQNVNFAPWQNFKFCHFQPVHCASKNPRSPNVFNFFSKSLPPAEDVEGGNFCEKFKVRRYFTFAIATWKLCASATFEILPLLTCTLCQEKSYISKGIQPIFEIFASARRCSGWQFGWKV